MSIYKKMILLTDTFCLVFSSFFLRKHQTAYLGCSLTTFPDVIPLMFKSNFKVEWFKHKKTIKTERNLFYIVKPRLLLELKSPNHIITKTQKTSHRQKIVKWATIKSPYCTDTYKTWTTLYPSSLSGVFFSLASDPLTAGGASEPLSVGSYLLTLPLVLLFWHPSLCLYS